MCQESQSLLHILCSYKMIICSFPVFYTNRNTRLLSKVLTWPNCFGRESSSSEAGTSAKRTSDWANAFVCFHNCKVKWRMFKSKLIKLNSEQPSLALQIFQNKSALLSWSKKNCPLLSCSDVIAFFWVLDRSIGMEEFGVTLAKFHPFNCTSLFPINHLLVQKWNKMFILRCL